MIALRTIGGLAALATIVMTPEIAGAQGRPAGEGTRRGSVEISGGAIAVNGTDLPNFAATLTRNPPTGSAPLQLFNADAAVARALGGQARLGFYVTPAISIEGGVQYARPQIRVRLTADFEDAADTTVTETVSSYLFTGSVLYHLAGGRRLRPFIMGGAGHVRDLHAAGELVETGNEFHAGGGIKSWFGKGPSKLGIRAEVVVSIRDGGIGTDEGRRTVPTAGLSLAYLF